MEIEDDIDIPGWFVVTDAEDADTQQQWLEQCASELGSLLGTNRWDGEPATAEDLAEMLRYALLERQTSDDDAVLQVWPVPYLAPLLCRLNLVESSTLPDWHEEGAITHGVTAPHLGAGLQVSTRRVVNEVDLVSVQLVFDDGESAFMMGLDEAPAPVVTRALPELMFLSEAIRLVDAHGAVFTGTGPAGEDDEEPWPFAEEGQS